MLRLNFISRPLGALVLLLAVQGLAQDRPSPSLPLRTFSRELQAAAADSLVNLPDQFILPASDTVRIDSGDALRRGIDYTVSYREGALRLDSALIAGLFSASRGQTHILRIAYLYFPFRFPGKFVHREPVARRDSTGLDTIRVARPTASYAIDDLFGPGVQKSGSIFRGLTVGSNRDLTLNSGFRMQLAGKVTSDIAITAALTDENTPIQPEGTTQTLQEFDKVFVELRGSHFTSTMGDFMLELKGGEFSRLNRKLQGAEGAVDFRSGGTRGSFLAAGAVTRGKFNTLQFNGLEAVQGPYRLTGRNGEPSIIVIAGTEKVYVNGERMVRGETNDYVIDYSTGEVTFTAKRLITSASRLTIDYEYSDRQYSRSLLGGEATVGLFDDKAMVSFTYFREADDPNAPIDLSISDTARQVLERAGADPSRATLPGAALVDSGGVYLAVDTLLAGGDSVRIYRYAPGDPRARYRVSFSFAGTGKGDYQRQQAGVFVWQGKGGGDFLPVQFLPLPTSDQVMDLALTVAPLPALSMKAEFAQSSLSANRFSSLPGVVTNGGAMNLTAAWSPRNLHIAGLSLDGIDVGLKERKVGSRFVPLDRTNDIEFTRLWGVDTLAVADEEIREATLRVRPVKGIEVGGFMGTNRRGDLQSSDRVAGDLLVTREGLPQTRYMVERIKSSLSSTGTVSTWLRQKGSVTEPVGFLSAGFQYEGEHREIAGQASALQPGSFSFDAFGPKLSLNDLGPFLISGELLWRSDRLERSGVLAPASLSTTQTYAARMKERGDFSTTLDVTLREMRYTPEFHLLGNSDMQTILVRDQSRFTPFGRGVEADLYYETGTQRTSRLERVFVRVPIGTGNYRYLGDLNNNGLADETEFELTRFDGDFVAVTVPTDRLFPIIDLKSSFRLRITPSRFIEKGPGVWNGLARAVTTETYLRVEEKSTEPDLKKIYLLHLSRFLNDSTTLAGTQLFTQDFLFFDGQPSFSARFRFSGRRGLVNYSGGAERSEGGERSVRMRWRMGDEIANQFDYVHKTDRLTSIVATTRAREITGDNVAMDFSYRPEQRMELGLKFEVGRSTDRLPSVPTVADLNTQSVRCVYAFPGAGQVRGEFSREEVGLSQTLPLVPYELTGGRVGGKTWIWRLGFEYRLTQSVQASASYDGRSEGGGLPVHTARAEVRAFF
jgi:hypothetical protein